MPANLKKEEKKRDVKVERKSSSLRLVWKHTNETMCEITMVSARRLAQDLNNNVNYYKREKALKERFKTK